MKRYFYTLRFDHNGSEKARKAVDRANTAIAEILKREFGENGNIAEYGYSHDFTEDVTDNYKETK